MTLTDPSREVQVQPLRPRTVGERRAYMDGQLAALELAARKGVEYAQEIVAAVHRGFPLDLLGEDEKQ